MTNQTVSRRAFMASAAAAGAAIGFPLATRAMMANATVRLGFISCGGRANGLMSAFSGVQGVDITAMCDPDETRLGKTNQRFPRAKGYQDLRKVIEDDNVDAVVVATCNHWHCLASIMAMEAGKDVYVEKPLSHSQWEGAQTVAAARKYKRICQVGTQQRSDPMQAEIKKFLHEDKVLGNLLSARVNRFGVRGPIGKRSTPLPIDKTIAYDLWLGPAADKPVFRNKLQYDWHWDWNTGSGEMGNWGVHVLDDVRNNVFLDKVTLPKRILGGGGRIVWHDAGETPNVHFVYFDTGSIPVVIGLTNLTAGPNEKKSPTHPGPGSGYIAYCEGGRVEGQRGRGTAFDNNGEVIRQFKGTGGMGAHQQNFIDAVRSRKQDSLNSDVAVGNDSTGWCNMANIAFRAGSTFDPQQSMHVGVDVWDALLKEMHSHLQANAVPPTDNGIQVSSILNLDPATGRFHGAGSDTANSFLKREYRKGYEVPDFSA
jgi:predicted dehydrogenase